MNHIENFLKTQFQVEQSEVESVANRFEYNQIRNGDSLLKTGQYCKKMFILKDGILRISALSEGKDITQWIATSGYFVTDLNSFLLGDKARWNIDAITYSEIYSISKTEYDKLKNIIPSWFIKERSFIVNCFTTMENRIFEFLSTNAEERYLQLFHSNKELFHNVPLQYLASMLGMSPETLSRIRRKTLDKSQD